MDKATALTGFVHGANVESVEEFLVPPGEYRMAAGFAQNAGMDVKFTVYANGWTQNEGVIGESETITLGSATTYHYDRGTTLAKPYQPEWFDVSYSGNSSKAANYDGDGGLIISKLTVPDVKGDGSPVRLMFRITSPSWNSKTKIYFNHWCLRPTAGNY